MTEERSGQPKLISGDNEPNQLHVGGGALRGHGINPNEKPDANQWARLCRLVKALVSNPHLLVGADSSTIIFPQPHPVRSGSGGTTAAPAATECFFGELFVDVDTKTYIRGGTVRAGDKTFNVPNYEVVLGTPVVKLVQLKVSVEVYRDDNNEVLMPGVKTSSEATGAGLWDLKTWTDPTDYDTSTNPEVDDGLGEIVIGLGKLTVAAGVATYNRTGCGNFVITHCAGSLGYSR